MKIDNLIDEVFDKSENNISINSLCLKLDKKSNLANFDNFKICKLYLLNTNEETYLNWCYLLVFTYQKYYSVGVVNNPYLTVYQQCLVKLAESAKTVSNKSNFLIMMKFLALALSNNLSKYLKLNLDIFKTKLFNLMDITLESIYNEFNIDELLKLKHSWQSNMDYESRADSVNIPNPISPKTLYDLIFIDYNLPIYNIKWNELEANQDSNYFCIPDFALIDRWKLAFNQTLDPKMIKVFLSELYLPPDANRLLPLIFKESITKEQILKLSEFNLDLMLIFIDSVEKFPKKFNEYTQLILELPINVNYLNLISNIFAFEIKFKEQFYQKLINNLINYCQPNTLENESNNSNDLIRKLLLISEFLLSWIKLPINTYLKSNLLELKNTFLSYLAWGNIKSLINWIDDQFNKR